MRDVTAWWLHLVGVVASTAVTAYAFVREFAAVRENRRIIDEINATLDAREAAPEEPAEAAS